MRICRINSLVVGGEGALLGQICIRGWLLRKGGHTYGGSKMEVACPFAVQILYMAGNEGAMLDFGSPCAKGSTSLGCMPFCDQEDETINHILLSCVFARTAWAAIYGSLDKPEWTPSPHDVLAEWAIDKKGVNNLSTKDLRTIFALVW